MILVDNKLGLSVQAALDLSGNKVKVEDSFIFGESTNIAKDCPGSPMPCYCERKGGFMLSGSTVEAKDPINRDIETYPIYKIVVDSAFASEVFIKDVEFKNFIANTACGGK